MKLIVSFYIIKQRELRNLGWNIATLNESRLVFTPRSNFVLFSGLYILVLFRCITVLVLKLLLLQKEVQPLQIITSNVMKRVFLK